MINSLLICIKRQELHKLWPKGIWESKAHYLFGLNTIITKTFKEWVIHKPIILKCD